MMSLFSSFDFFWFFFPSNFEILFLLVFFLLAFKNSLWFSFFLSIKSFMMSFFSSLNLSMSIGSKMFFFSLMSFFLMLNFSSVFPFVFAYTSQIGIVFFVGFSIWLSFFLFFLKNNFFGVLFHFVPEGSPMVLVPFLFLIELVSVIIRPLTLSVRLVANILAGHLLLILLSKVVFLVSSLFLLHFMLTTVEFFVAIIQSYIFVTMVSLYFCDVN